MAISQAICTSFKAEVLTATHNFTNTTGNTFKLALFRAQASIVGTFGAGTTNYSNMGADEASGTNYVAGGSALTNVTPTTSGTTGYTDFDDLVFSTVTITTSGALIYNDTNSDRAVMVLNFGSDKTATMGNLTIQFPAAAAATAILRLT